MYIKRTEALDITTRTCGDYAAAWFEIRKLPAADVAPVIRGRWTRYSTFMMSCTICGRHTARHKFSYCPHCGAKMDGGDSDAKSV